MIRWVVLLALCATACVGSESVACGDRTCPAGTSCDSVRGLCLTDAQTTACNGIDDGERCDAAGTPGICERGFCEPGCGDGVTDPGEECDDGNFASHDGCSSRCVVETLAWAEVKSPWTGAAGAAIVYHQALGRVVMFGGQTDTGIVTTMWQRDSAMASSPSNGWRDVSSAFDATNLPPARYLSAYGYDPVREVMVVFGGSSGFATLGDTWEYRAVGLSINGEPIGAWQQITAATAPSPRQDAVMAFDPVLGKLVLFGGQGSAGLETWTYDGTWTRLNTAAAPTGVRRGSALVYDANAGRLILFGGGGPDVRTWLFDRATPTWTPITTVPAPDARRRAAIVFDPVLDKTVMFGGTLLPGDLSASDTWEFDGISTWTLRSVASAPPARASAAMVIAPDATLLVAGADVQTRPDVWKYDTTGWGDRSPRFGPAPTLEGASTYVPTERAMYTLGGYYANGNVIDEMWSFDGLLWRLAPRSPRPVYGHAITFDTDRERLVVFDGSCTVCAETPRTFEYNPALGEWSQNMAVSPQTLLRNDPAMAYDPDAKQTILFGGVTDLGVRLDDTWSYDGTTWTQETGATKPAAGARPPMSWDPHRRSIVLVDGPGVTWEHKAGAWTKLIDVSGDGPIGRYFAGFFFDERRSRLALVGGANAATFAPLDDIWDLDSETLAWTKRFVAGLGPLPRREFEMVEHPAARAYVLYGGLRGTSTILRDVWTLRYTSTTIDENCHDNHDTDGDKQQDGDDPDCFPPPPQ